MSSRIHVSVQRVWWQSLGQRFQGTACIWDFWSCPSFNLPQTVSRFIFERFLSFSPNIFIFAETPLSLQSKCRLAIRHQVGIGRVNQIPSLNIPHKLKLFLHFMDFCFDTGRLNMRLEKLPEIPCFCLTQGVLRILWNKKNNFAVR